MEELNEEIVSIPYAQDKMLVMKITPFNTDIDVDDLLKIDYSNLLGEILTFSVIFNRIAMLRADCQNIVNRGKVELEIFEAELSEIKRNDLTKLGAKVTVGEIDNAVKRDPFYIKKKNNYFEKVKNFDYVDALYWSAQSKLKLLEKISDKLSPKEFEREILEGTINGVMVKSVKRAIV